MDARSAVAQVADIQSRLSQVQTFRGYRSASVGASGLLAIAAGFLQPILLPKPAAEPLFWVMIWIVVAIVSVTMTAIPMLRLHRNSESPWLNRLAVSAIARILPSIAVGGIVTLALLLADLQNIRMLPGIWSVIFSLGIFASAPVLVRTVNWVGIWYFVCGTLNLLVFHEAFACSPMTMAVPFGGGQLLGALILYRYVEQGRG